MMPFQHTHPRARTRNAHAPRYGLRRTLTLAWLRWLLWYRSRVHRPGCGHRHGRPCLCLHDIYHKLDCLHGMHRWSYQYDNVIGWWRTCRHCGVPKEAEEEDGKR